MSLSRCLIATLILSAPLAAAEPDHAKITIDDATPIAPQTLEVGLSLDHGWAQDSLAHDGTRVSRDSTATSTTIGLSATHGLAPDLDGRAAISWATLNESDAVPDHGTGLGDLDIGLKWRFYAEENLEFALLPWVAVPLARHQDPDEQLTTSANDPSYGLTLAASGDVGEFTADVATGLTRNTGSTADDTLGGFHLGTGVGWQVTDQLQPVAEVLYERDLGVDGDTPWTVTGTLGLIMPLASSRWTAGLSQVVAGQNADLETTMSVSGTLIIAP